MDSNTELTQALEAKLKTLSDLQKGSHGAILVDNQGYTIHGIGSLSKTYPNSMIAGSVSSIGQASMQLKSLLGIEENNKTPCVQINFDK